MQPRFNPRIDATSEAELGNRATHRMQELVNAGPFSVSMWNMTHGKGVGNGDYRWFISDRSGRYPDEPRNALAECQSSEQGGTGRNIHMCPCQDRESGIGLKLATGVKDNKKRRK